MKKELFEKKLRHFNTEGAAKSGEYFQSAVLVLLVLIEDEFHVVFEKRAAHIRQGGEICLPGGKIDPTDVSPKAAAVRETCEELGCAKEALEVFAKLQPLTLPTGVKIHPYAAFLHQSLAELTLETAEVEELFTVPLSFFAEHQPDSYACKVLVHPYIDTAEGQREVLLPAAELGLPRRYHEPWGEAQQTIYLYQVDQRIIWGLTATILMNFMEQLNG